MSRWAFLTPQDAPTGSIERTLILPEGEEWEALARGALALLLSANNYEQAIDSAITPEDAAAEFAEWLLATFTGWTA